jgi:hypothetical protein
MKVSDLFEAEEKSILSVMGKQEDQVAGDFSCYNNNLTSLEGSPKEVGGIFFCSYNNLTSLEGSPKEVGGNFSCYHNKLTSLEGSPKEVGGNFDCSYNNLTSLEGSPKEVGGNFDCSCNKLTSLRNIHKHVKKMIGEANFEDNNIKSCVLGLLLIDGLTVVLLKNKKVQKIINKHLKGDRKGDRDIFACQEELIEHGYDEFAKL